MRLLTALVLGSVALAWTADAMAGSRSKSRTVRSYEQAQYVEYRRSNTVAPNGLCQRDTGTHNSQLSFRNKCDTLEFWERMNRNGRR